MKVFSVAEMIAAEKKADELGVSYAQMMETAGRGVAEAILARYPVAGKSVLVLVGPGNNGGDGLVAGRYLAEAGADVAFYLTKMRNPETDINLAKAQEMGLFMLDAGFDQRFRVLRTRLQVTDIVIDALLGTGVSRPIGGGLAKMMRQVQQGINESRRYRAAEQRSSLQHITQLDKHTSTVDQLAVVAVDCPSGLNCNSGALDPLAITADLTVTFAGPKRGHFAFPGAKACGELVVADIGIPEQVTQKLTTEVTTAVSARTLLPKRPLDGHKGTFGRVLIAGGSARYWGAPLLSARAAFRTGAGLVALAVPQVIRPTLATQLPEATFPPLEVNNELDGQSAETLLKTIEQQRALLIGPGLDNAASFLHHILATTKPLPPLLIDADGLNLLAQMDNWPAKLPPNTVLTPHPGEMARLMNISLAELLQLDRLSLAQENAQAWGHIILLKGAYTIVASPSGQATILPFANPVLAVGGSGDVLAGVIASLLAQGVAPYEAAVCGGYVHGATSLLTNGRSGLLAHELADLIPAVIQKLS